MTGRQKPSVKTMLLVSGAVILVMFAISAFVWMQIPAGESVCTHWNAAGECDDHGSKFVGSLGCTAALLRGPAYHPDA